MHRYPAFIAFMLFMAGASSASAFFIACRPNATKIASNSRVPFSFCGRLCGGPCDLPLNPQGPTCKIPIENRTCSCSCGIRLICPTATLPRAKVIKFPLATQTFYPPKTPEFLKNPWCAPKHQNTHSACLKKPITPVARNLMCQNTLGDTLCLYCVCQILTDLNYHKFRCNGSAASARPRIPNAESSWKGKLSLPRMSNIIRCLHGFHCLHRLA